MSLLIDLLLIGIVAYCGWQGFKKGIVNGAFGIVALIAAIFIGHLVGTVYSDEFSGMFQPFAGGVIDTSIATVTEYRVGDTNRDGTEKEPPVVVLSDSERSDVHAVCFAALRQLGVCESVAEDIATETAQNQRTVDQEMSRSLTLTLCSRIGYLLVSGIVFAVSAIVFAIISNVINLYFELPRLETANKIGGTVLGVVKGYIIIMFIACICRYAGLAIGNDRIIGTVLLERLINHNKIAGILGI